ncbi:hypothetical protein GWK47_014276 [Chionoecetes opilio]|uniref:Uncharacterized protein n=1 Tax=Chionoecetes opilio TaxID=41210 RepID=A0A8J5CIX4_CHIOP|nr:hypothetical protein GWK47_014276 [Chionoecetes opilio]
MSHSEGMTKFHSPSPSSGGELSPSDRSLKHASNHPRMTRQYVASHRLSPDVTAAPTLAPHPGKAPARPISSKKAAATHASTSAASTNADCPEPFNDDTTASASNHPRKSKESDASFRPSSDAAAITARTARPGSTHARSGAATKTPAAPASTSTGSFNTGSS